MVKEQTLILSSGSSVSTGNANFSAIEPNKLVFKLPNGLSLTDRDQIALKSVSIPYSWRTITSILNNNSFHYSLSGASSKQITIPDGNYSFTDFIGYFQFILDQNGDYLVDNQSNHVYFIKFDINSVYYGLTLTLSPVPYSLPTGWTNPNNIPLSGVCPQVIIDNNNFGKFIGFNTGIYLSNPQSIITEFNSNSIALVSNITTI